MKRTALLVTAMGLAGCTTAQRDRGANEPPDIRWLDEAPTRMSVTIGNLTDQDDNGWPDVVPITAHLYTTYGSQPVAARGRFEFLLEDMNRDVLQEWRVSEQDSPKAIKIVLGLTGYSFRLRLPAGRRERRFPDWAYVTIRFVPANGAPPLAHSERMAFRSL